MELKAEEMDPEVDDRLCVRRGDNEDSEDEDDSQPYEDAVPCEEGLVNIV